MLASTTIRPVTPHTCAISSTTSAASRKPRPGAAILLRNGHAEEAGVRQRLDVVPGILLGPIGFGGTRRDHLARQRAGPRLKVLSAQRSATSRVLRLRGGRARMTGGSILPASVEDNRCRQVGPRALHCVSRPHRLVQKNSGARPTNGTKPPRCSPPSGAHPSIAGASSSWRRWRWPIWRATSSAPPMSRSGST